MSRSGASWRVWKIPNAPYAEVFLGRVHGDHGGMGARVH